MARTYRRLRGKKPNPRWFYAEWVTIERRTSVSHYTGQTYSYAHKEWVRYSPDSANGRRIKARFHSDAGYSLKESAPSRFVNLYCTRPFRRATKQAIYNQLKDLEKEVMFPKHVKDAAWLYW